MIRHIRKTAQYVTNWNVILRKLTQMFSITFNEFNNTNCCYYSATMLIKNSLTATVEIYISPTSHNIRSNSCIYFMYFKANILFILWLTFSPNSHNIKQNSWIYFMYLKAFSLFCVLTFPAVLIFDAHFYICLQIIF